MRKKSSSLKPKVFLNSIFKGNHMLPERKPWVWLIWCWTPDISKDSDAQQCTDEVLGWLRSLWCFLFQICFAIQDFNAQRFQFFPWVTGSRKITFLLSEYLFLLPSKIKGEKILCIHAGHNGGRKNKLQKFQRNYLMIYLNPVSYSLAL